MDGSVYDGLWDNDKRHDLSGDATMTWKDKTEYKGQFI